MYHKFTASFALGNNNNQKMEMTYDDDDIVTTLRRRLITAFPTAINIDIKRSDDDRLNQLELSENKKK